MSKQIEFAGSVLEFWCGKTHALHVPRGSQIQDLMLSDVFTFFGASPRCAIESFSHSLKAKGKGLIAGWMGKLNKCSEIMRN